MRLRELAEDLQNQKQQRKQNLQKKSTLPSRNENVDGTYTSESCKGIPNRGSHENLDEMWDMSYIYNSKYEKVWRIWFDKFSCWSFRLAASIMAEENGLFLSSASSFSGATFAKEDSGERSILVSFFAVYVTLT